MINYKKIYKEMGKNNPKKVARIERRKKLEILKKFGFSEAEEIPWEHAWAFIDKHVDNIMTSPPSSYRWVEELGIIAIVIPDKKKRAWAMRPYCTEQGLKKVLARV